MIKTYITANEARALSKANGCTDIAIQPYITHMFEEIREQAKIGNTKLFVDVIDYAYYFNMSIVHSCCMFLMEEMEKAAKEKGFCVKRLFPNREYFVVSWAET